MSRFYIEGHEVDVQNPSFFIPEDRLEEVNEAINELRDYYD